MTSIAYAMGQGGAAAGQGAGGFTAIHGRITNVDENVLTVEIADQVKIKLNRGNVTALLQTANPPAAEKPGKTETGK